MFDLRKIIKKAARQICATGRRWRALRELETLDQATLNDLGMSRGQLVALSHGHDAAACAAY